MVTTIFNVIGHGSTAKRQHMGLVGRARPGRGERGGGWFPATVLGMRSRNVGRG